MSYSDEEDVESEVEEETEEEKVVKEMVTACKYGCVHYGGTSEIGRGWVVMSLLQFSLQEFG